jgi:hypothetical protein
MRRLVVLVALLGLVGAVTATAQAQGLCFPGFGCGSSCDPGKGFGSPAIYVGYMDVGKGVEFTLTSQNLGAFGLYGSRQRFASRGLWVGGSYTAGLSDSFGVLLSGWYLLPGKSTSSQSYDGSGLGIGDSSRAWRVTEQWWHVDGLAALGDITGFSVLGGLRLDRQDAHFKDVTDPVGIASLPTDEAELASTGWIPLVGCQYAAGGSGLVIRVVGFPAFLGSAKYKETFGGSYRDEVSGSYRRGGFIEVFGEFTRKVNNAELGAFLRYNATGARGNLSYTSTFLGTGTATDTFDLTLYRTTWTGGVTASLAF